MLKGKSTKNCKPPRTVIDNFEAETLLALRRNARELDHRTARARVLLCGNDTNKSSSVVSTKSMSEDANLERLDGNGRVELGANGAGSGRHGCSRHLHGKEHVCVRCRSSTAAARAHLSAT